jgi:predicted alpha-1,6-mannanase (GH76 family)
LFNIFRKLAVVIFASVMVMGVFPVAQISSSSSISMTSEVTKAATISSNARYNAYGMYAVSALQAWYKPSTGVWNNIAWWQSANALESVIDYSTQSKTKNYLSIVSNTYNKNAKGKFLNRFYDDEGWWALAWIKAYDVTRDPRYLTMAKTIFKDMTGGWDSTYGGGIWWNKDRNYKNAIANELFLAIAAKLHLRTPGDKSYLNWAQKEWNWFKNSDMINAQHLINDGLNKTGHNNGRITWTYNQGVILGGLVDLFKSTADASFLSSAILIADSATKTLTYSNGILREPVENSTASAGDETQFKGIFIRNLKYLYDVSQKPDYLTFITKNVDSIWQNSRNKRNQFGEKWVGPIGSANASRQSAALDAINCLVTGPLF